MKRIAYVKWVDSTSYGAIHKDEAHEVPVDQLIESSGLIIHEDPGKTGDIHLALHFNWKQDHYTEDVRIPKESIKKIRRLKIED